MVKPLLKISFNTGKAISRALSATKKSVKKKKTGGGDRRKGKVGRKTPSGQELYTSPTASSTIKLANTYAALHLGYNKKSFLLNDWIQNLKRCQEKP